jgi:sugar O-acyltransferase (sialic acid O-acetyltransferase NeuD family)
MDIVLFGTGGHAKVVAEVVAMQGLHRVVGLVSEDGVNGDFIEGLDVIASNQNFKKILPDHGVKGAIIALGLNKHRINLAELIGDGLEFVTAVHPAAFVSPQASLQPGSVVMAGAVINPGTNIGAHCIVNTASSIDHDCQIGDFTHICPGVVIAGHVTVGQGCWLGIGSVVSDHLTIGDRAFISAGATVVADIAPNSKLGFREQANS